MSDTTGAGESRTLTFRDESGPAQPPPNGAGTAAPPAAKLKPSGRRASAEETAEIQRQRAAIHDKARERGAAIADEQPAAPSPPREPVESIELMLPNGRAVEYGPPHDVSLSLRIVDILGDETAAAKVVIVRTVLCVRKIDGRKPPGVANMVDVQKIANMISDDGLDILYVLHNTHWPPITSRDLPAVKKNLRQS